VGAAVFVGSGVAVGGIGVGDGSGVLVAGISVGVAVGGASKGIDEQPVKLTRTTIIRQEKIRDFEILFFSMSNVLSY
jgi:hypothetical protein